MYARVSTFMGKPENISQAIKPLKEAFITKEKGWKGGYALVNRQTGKMLTMTLWETKEDMEATVKVGNKIRGQAASLAGAAPPIVEIYIQI